MFLVAHRTRPRARAALVAAVAAALLAPNLLGDRAATAAGRSRAAATTAVWPQYGYSAARTFFNPNEHTINPGNVSTLHRLWSKVELAPSEIAANGLLYGLERANYYLDAFNAQTGARAWHGIFNDEWSHTFPAAGNGLVYVGTGDMGTLVALDAKTGRERWTSETNNEDTQPLLANGAVYFSGSPEQLDPERVCSIDALSGAYRWCNGGGDPVAVANGVVYVSSFDGVTGRNTGLSARSATDGHETWSSRGLDHVSVANGLVYGTSGRTLQARDARTGVLRWSTTQSSAEFGWLAVTGTTLYAQTTYGGASRIHAYRASSGMHLWSAPAGGTASSTLAVAGGVVFVATQNGRLSAFDGSTGVLRWRLATAVRSPIIVANGTLYFASTYDSFSDAARVNAYTVS